MTGTFMRAGRSGAGVLGGGGASEPTPSADEGGVLGEVSGGTFYGPVFQGRDFTVASIEDTGDKSVRVKEVKA